MRARPTLSAPRFAFAIAALFTSLLFGAGLSACGPRGPQPMAYDGTESCEVCRMAVTDRRYGAQVVTRTGRAHRFDSVECVATYWTQLERTGEGEGASVWVTDFTRPGTLVDARTARFVRSQGRASPMGLGLLAVEHAADADKLARTFEGQVLTWPEVLTLVAERAAAGTSHEHRHAPAS